MWFDPSGRARGVASERAARFDAERNALFLSSLLEDRSIRVQYVFMHPALQRLVRSAAGRDASRLARVLRTPRGRLVDPHADHLHVRIHCPAADVAFGCADR